MCFGLLFFVFNKGMCVKSDNALPFLFLSSPQY